MNNKVEDEELMEYLNANKVLSTREINASLDTIIKTTRELGRQFYSLKNKELALTYNDILKIHHHLFTMFDIIEEWIKENKEN